VYTLFNITDGQYLTDGQYQKEIVGQTEDVIDGAPIYLEPLLVYVFFGTTTQKIVLT
jgi:hypothetical protein